MPNTKTDSPTSPRPIRLWPGVLFAALLLFANFGLPLVIPALGSFGVIFAIVAALAIIVWWVFFSRAPWADRLGALVVMIAAVLLTSRGVHASISNGMMGMMLPILSIPVMSVALVAALLIARGFSRGLRRALIVVAILLSCGSFALLRTGGISGDGDSDLHWRWTPSPEERLLAEAKNEPAALPSAPAATTAPVPVPPRDGPGSPSVSPSNATTENNIEAKAGEEAAFTTSPIVTRKEADWPGFRGRDRDSIIPGVRIETDWSKSPPVELWRKPIGPGWSSFAVDGDLVYTQEQRGDDEIVACYRLSTGEPVWRHRDPVRFWESNGGAGPRATPTLSNGRVYAFGATGILNALDASTGAVIWSHNVASEASIEVPAWGFSSSPLVVSDVVIVAADATLVAHDLATGRQRWVGPVHQGSYSSPHRTTIDGVEQVLLLGGTGATSVAPASGAVLWEHSWPGTAIVQPALMADGSVLINSLATTGGLGTRRLAIAHGPSGWKAEERWTSNGLKPYFNDFVVHKGYAFGFDGSILASIDLENGARKWKGGRYGNGQIVLLPDQDLLLVLSEEGELAIVSATPDQFKEITRFRAIQGKTWNHPVVVGDTLLVRNGEEMAAFRLPLAR